MLSFEQKDLELYLPANPAEREIVEQLTDAQWNLRRARMMHDVLLDEFYADHTRRLGYAFRRDAKTLSS